MLTFLQALSWFVLQPQSKNISITTAYTATFLFLFEKGSREELILGVCDLTCRRLDHNVPVTIHIEVGPVLREYACSTKAAGSQQHESKLVAVHFFKDGRK